MDKLAPLGGVPLLLCCLGPLRQVPFELVEMGDHSFIHSFIHF